MKWHKSTIDLSTQGKGLYAFTEQLNAQLRSWNVREGMCFLFCPHTSASLTINENYDPTAQSDLESSLERLVPDRAGWYAHDLEGEDDSTSHIRAMLTDTSLVIPIDSGRLSLGQWQGIYLFEHRTRSRNREVWIRVLDMSE